MLFLTFKQYPLEYPNGEYLDEPILFLLYINDIGHVVNDSNENLMLFADDSNAFITPQNMTELK